MLRAAREWTLLPPHTHTPEGEGRGGGLGASCQLLR